MPSLSRVRNHRAGPMSTSGAASCLPKLLWEDKATQQQSAPAVGPGAPCAQRSPSNAQDLLEGWLGPNPGSSQI